ncbi:hypothetical protein ACO2I3_07290 [Leptospira interrogans]
MSFQRVAPWLILALCLSVAVIVLGAGRGAQMLVGASAGLFALVVLVVGLRANQPLWSEEQTTDEAAVEAARFNAWLMAIAFVWGAVAMFAVYTLSGLRWQHGWQYGAGMALLGAFAYVFGVLLDRAGPGARRPVLQRGLQLTMLQGVAAVAGLVFLIGSGKLETFRPDWAANQIFLFGGLAIVGLSAIAVITQRKLMRA